MRGRGGRTAGEVPSNLVRVPESWRRPGNRGDGQATRYAKIVTDPWSIFWTGLFVVAGPLIVVFLNQHHQRKQGSLEDERRLRDARRERFRSTYATVLRVTSETVRNANELPMTVVARSQIRDWASRYAEILERGQDTVREARLLLTMEDFERASLLGLFDQIQHTYFRLELDVFGATQEPEKLDMQQVRARWEEIERLREVLVKEIQRHLAELDQPI